MSRTGSPSANNRAASGRPAPFAPSTAQVSGHCRTYLSSCRESISARANGRSLTRGQKWAWRTPSSRDFAPALDWASPNGPDGPAGRRAVEVVAAGRRYLTGPGGGAGPAPVPRPRPCRGPPVRITQVAHTVGYPETPVGSGTSRDRAYSTRHHGSERVDPAAPGAPGAGRYPLPDQSHGLEWPRRHDPRAPDAGRRPQTEPAATCPVSCAAVACGRALNRWWNCWARSCWPTGQPSAPRCSAPRSATSPRRPSGATDPTQTTHASKT
jgi:hypothetical protein